MKIAIFSFYSGYWERGVENWTDQLATRLSSKHQVVVFQNSPSKQTSNYQVKSAGLKVDWDRKDTASSLFRLFFVDYWSLLVARFTLKFFPMLLKEHFDIIIPTNGGWQVAFLRLLTWLRGGKIVVVGHSGLGWDDRNNLWSFPDVFVALSSRAEKWARRVNPLVRIAVIPNGVDLSLFTPKGKRVKIPLQRPVILMVGALEPGKRMDLAIEAVSRLKRGSLLILGRGLEEKRIKKLGKEKLGDRFLLRSVSFKEIPMYYRSADLFTLPSWENEAFGMVYLEAMASNLPVVATNDELRHEIVGDAGILVDPTDIDAYAQALQLALKTNWGDKPRAQAQKFSWEKVIKEYEKLFADLVR